MAELCVMGLRCMMVPARDAVLAKAEQDLGLVSVSQHLGKKLNGSLSEHNSTT